MGDDQHARVVVGATSYSTTTIHPFFILLLLLSCLLCCLCSGWCVLFVLAVSKNRINTVKAGQTIEASGSSLLIVGGV